jgi:EAL and modified HD-GYP domain-containing signal transduction protein
VPDPVSLGAATIRWGLLVGRDRRAAGVRLEIGPGSGERPVVLSSLLGSVVHGLADDPAGAFPRGLMLLAPGNFAIDDGLAQWSAPRNVLLEVPVSGLGEESRMRVLFEARRRGLRQALNVQDGMPALERLQFFQYLVGEGGIAASSSIAWMSLGAASEAESQACFAGGAAYVVPAPQALPCAREGAGFSPSQRAIFELVRLIRSDADLHAIEGVFQGEPLLAYMLLTLANSVAFRRGGPTASLRQAVMKIGYQRLVKWLVLILAVSNKEAQVAPLVFRALVRGYCMEHMAEAANMEADARDEAFIVGAFTLLDRITGQPLPALLGEVELPDRVSAALLRCAGPYAPLLRATRELEGSDEPGMGEPHGLGAEAVNSALLRAVSAADSMVALG